MVQVTLRFDYERNPAALPSADNHHHHQDSIMGVRWIPSDADEEEEQDAMVKEEEDGEEEDSKPAAIEREVIDLVSDSE